jgi:hypothetical protein
VRDLAQRWQEWFPICFFLNIANAHSIIRPHHSFSCVALHRPYRAAQNLILVNTAMPLRPKRVGKPTQKRKAQLMEEVIEDAKAPLGARPILEEHANNNKFNKIALIVAAVRWSQASAKQRAERPAY